VARPKEFDRDTVLDHAVKAFANHGFGGTSTDDLLAAMGISRQSLYDTFGDKKSLYLAALRHYNEQSVSHLIRILNTAGSPLKGIEAALLEFAGRPTAEAALGCMGVSAVCEWGRSDDSITAITDGMGTALVAALERRFADAKALGEVDPELDVKTAARFVSSSLSGLKVTARAGASVAELRAIVRMTLRSFV
jgi:TetR/AcrR family transcriptional repressor of nem operon